MTSLDSAEVSSMFRLKTQIHTYSSLQTCFEFLQLNKSDLIITNGCFMKQIQNTPAYHEAALLNLDEYGAGEPNAAWVDQVVEKANDNPYHRVIGIGGGSTIDIAKLCIFGDGRDVKAIFQEKTELEKRRDLIIIPTTCGTGSEVTSVSVMEFDDLQSKLGLQLDLLFPDKAILVSDLLQTLPYATFAISSIDALAHAVESLLSPKANAYTDMFAKTAIEGILKTFMEIKRKNCLPANMEKSLLCANMTGIAFSIAGCATMHALSFPLGSNYHLAHGEAVYAVFGSVLEEYAQMGVSLEKLTSILQTIFKTETKVIEQLMSLLKNIFQRPDFCELNINHEACEVMAVSVFEHQQRLLKNSPQYLNSHDLARIYKRCLMEDIYDNSNKS